MVQITQPPPDDAPVPTEWTADANGVVYFNDPRIMGMSFVNRRAVYAHINASTPEALDDAIAKLQAARTWMQEDGAA